MKALWKGQISFGLVSIPVSVVSAQNTDKELDFDLIDRRDHARVGYQKINKNTGEPIESRDIVKGLKLDSGKYIVFENKDLEKLKVKGSDLIEIQQFVERSDIDPAYYEKPYYLIPGKGGEKTYVLLREALRKSEKFAVGLIAMRSKQRVALIGATDRALTLELVRFAHELKKESAYDFPKTKTADVKISDREFSMAEQLISELSSDWKPEAFKDNYFDEVKKAAQKKSRSSIEVNEEESPEPQRSSVLDLMPLLERSLNAKRGKKKGGRSAALRAGRHAQKRAARK